MPIVYTDHSWNTSEHTGYGEKGETRDRWPVNHRIERERNPLSYHQASLTLLFSWLVYLWNMGAPGGNTFKHSGKMPWGGESAQLQDTQSVTKPVVHKSMGVVWTVTTNKSYFPPHHHIEFYMQPEPFYYIYQYVIWISVGWQLYCHSGAEQFKIHKSAAAISLIK